MFQGLQWLDAPPQWSLFKRLIRKSTKVSHWMLVNRQQHVQKLRTHNWILMGMLHWSNCTRHAKMHHLYSSTLHVPQTQQKLCFRVASVLFEHHVSPGTERHIICFVDVVLQSCQPPAWAPRYSCPSQRRPTNPSSIALLSIRSVSFRKKVWSSSRDLALGWALSCQDQYRSVVLQKCRACCTDIRDIVACNLSSTWRHFRDIHGHASGYG